MSTQDTVTKEQLVKALQEQNITDLDSLAEFMLEKRASLKTVEEDLKGGATTQGDITTQGNFVGRGFIFNGVVVK